jgi:murein DD-endopeptidase MepM/ murein hydrolase activator NlpD
LVLSACGGSKATYHVVRRGENLYRIGKAYGVSHEELARVNDIDDPSRIEVGQQLLIPGAEKAVPVDVVAPREVSRRRSRQEPVLPPDQRPFIWPVEGGEVSSLFGPRDRSFHDGIDIIAEEGTPIVAAADGEVVFADELRGYGRVIIVRHGGDYATVYAHNERNRVRAGERVKRGQHIADVGDSGRTTAPNLHFEVRRENVARDPLAYLPPEPRLAGRGTAP